MKDKFKKIARYICLALVLFFIVYPFLSVFLNIFLNFLFPNIIHYIFICLISPFWPDTLIGPTAYFVFLIFLFLNLLFVRKSKIKNFLVKLRLPMGLLLISYIFTVLSGWYYNISSKIIVSKGEFGKYGFPFQFRDFNSGMTDPYIFTEYVIADILFYFVILSVLFLLFRSIFAKKNS